MEKYKEQWLEIIKQSPVDGTLEALTVAALRNTNEDYNKKFSLLWSIISQSEPTNPYTKKLKEIYLSINPLPKTTKTTKYKKWWE
jgi:hypothetical protein